MLVPAAVQQNTLLDVDLVGGVVRQGVAESGQFREEVHEEDGNHYPGNIREIP